MKKTLYGILFAICPFVLFYLIGAFITLTWDNLRWGEDGRGLYIILSLIASACALGAFAEHYDD